MNLLMVLAIPSAIAFVAVAVRLTIDTYTGGSRWKDEL